MAIYTEKLRPSVREIALTLPGAVEGKSYGTPAFHVDKNCSSDFIRAASLSLL
jgi:hypothetical protein